jgi:glycosyltransferase involved in cell wall biosynthesis
MKKNIYFFHWPSTLGGADTRLKDLISLLGQTQNYNLYCIPNDDFRLQEQNNVEFLKTNNVQILTWESLPQKAEGYAIAFCNFRLFEEKWRLQKIKDIGLKFIWSNDMMWSSKEEAEAFEQKLVNAVIFTSEFHKNKLKLINPSFDKLPSFIVPNFFYEKKYNDFIKNQEKIINKRFTVGKLSRAEWTKYSENFPLFYHKIPVKDLHFRFMGWNDSLSEKYNWFEFKNNFELLKENEEDVLEFLYKLDLYVFTCHHNYTENQSRSIIEAQLLGIPCIAPNEGNFPNMIWHERTGYLYNNIEECYSYIKLIYENKNLFNLLKYNSKNLSRVIWCNEFSQIEAWEKIFLSL